MNQSPPSDLALADEMEHALRRNLCDNWFPRCIDSRGGYVENFDHAWRPSGDDRRSLVHQARIAWTAAAFAEHDAERRAEFTSHSLHGIAFIARTLLDDRHGGFFFDVSLSGRPLRNGEKNSRAIAFAIFAAAKAHAVTGESEPLEVARAGAAWLDAHCRRQNGTYVEDTDRHGTALVQAPNPRRMLGAVFPRLRRNPIGRGYGQTTLGTHLHLLEAYAEFHRADPGPVLRGRLESLLSLLNDSFVNAAGQLSANIGADARSSGPTASVGHSVETAHLMLDAAESLGLPEDPRTNAFASRVGLSVLENGWDSLYGGTFDEGATRQGGKVWWVQAEALTLWAAMYGRAAASGAWDDASRWREAIDAQWQFIRNHILDSRTGNWIKEVERDGRQTVRQPTSAPWLDPYHNTRALLKSIGILRGKTPALSVQRKS